MTKKLKLTSDEYSDFYSVLCDVMYRMDHPQDNPFRHTSSVARARAMAITDRLEAEGYLAECPVPNRMARR